MMKKPVFTAMIFFVVLFSCNPQTSVKDDKRDEKTSDEYNVAAYVWPSCHHDERFGDMLWPEGTGEWEVIKKGNPRFEGHYQPKVPLWGYEPDDDPKVMERWINAATDHGVNVFIFDWYWFDDGPFLESSLNNGFLKAKNTGQNAVLYHVGKSQCQTQLLECPQIQRRYLPAMGRCR